MITVRDLLKSERNSQARIARTGPIGETLTVSPDRTLEECLELMTRYDVRDLLVKEGGELLSSVSKYDVMQLIISVQQDRIEQLENYILGTGYGH